MLLQAAADFHGDTNKFRLFKKGIEKHAPDIIIVAGDVLDGSGKPLYDLVQDATIPVLISPGNMDTSVLNSVIESTGAVDMCEKKIIIDGYTFGEVGLRQTDTLFCFRKKKSKVSRLQALDVLISHIPPRGYMDKSMMGLHIGSKWIREVMEQQKPRLIVCGHVHENPGYVTINETIILNCSIGKMGEYSLIELGDDIGITMVGYPSVSTPPYRMI